MITREDLAWLAGLDGDEAGREIEKLLDGLDPGSLPPWHRSKSRQELVEDVLRQVDEIAQDQERATKRGKGLPDGAGGGPVV